MIFFSLSSITGIFTDTFSIGLIYAVLAIGIFLSYRILDFADLGAEGTFTLGAAITTLFTALGLNPFVAIFLSILGGLLAGAFTGFLTTKLKITPLLSGIITMTGLATINMIIFGASSDAELGNTFDLLTSNTNYISTPLKSRFYNFLYVLFHNTFGIKDFKPIYAAIILLVLIIVIVSIIIYYFFGTEIGMSVRATGMNSKMARAQGIDTDKTTILGLAISNGLIALSGSLLGQVAGQSSTSMGIGVLVIGLASIIIGEAVIGKKTFKQNLLAVIVGAIIYYLIIAIVINTGLLESHWLKFLYALMIVFILIFSNRKQIFKPKKDKEERK